MDFMKMTDDDILAIANPLMDNLMQASMDMDHCGHVRDFTNRLKAIVTPQHLAEACQYIQSTLGMFTTREPIAIFKRPNSVIVVWSQLFDRAEGEYKAEMALIHDGEKFLVDHAVVF